MTLPAVTSTKLIVGIWETPTAPPTVDSPSISKHMVILTAGQIHSS